jgi:hypothetical protein
MSRGLRTVLLALATSACGGSSPGSEDDESRGEPSSGGETVGTSGPSERPPDSAPALESSSGEDTFGGTSASGESTSGIDETDETGATTDSPMYTEACVDGCAVEAACGNEWSSELECIVWCEDNLVEAGRFSPFCRMAWENLHACIGTLDCAGYEDFLVGGRACQTAVFTHALECEGQF